MIAIGLGCRKGVAGDEVAALVRACLAQAGLNDVQAELFVPDRKQNEAGLIGAAQALGMSLRFLSHDALAAVQDQTVSRSAHALEAVGLASVCEAAALAGAGPGARLILPKTTSAGAACALATSERVVP